MITTRHFDALSLVVAVLLLTVGCVSNGKDGTSMASEQVLLTESFDGDGDQLPEGWWAEGGEKVWVQDGKLYVRANAPGKIARDRSNVDQYKINAGAYS